MRTLSCSMWDLVSWPGIERRPPALGASKLFLLFCYWPEGAQERLISFAFHSCSRTDDPHSFPAFNPGSLCVAWPRGGQQFLSLRGHLLDVSWRWQGGKKIDFRVRWIVALPLKPVWPWDYQRFLFCFLILIAWGIITPLLRVMVDVIWL